MLRTFSSTDNAALQKGGVAAPAAFLATPDLVVSFDPEPMPAREGSDTPMALKDVDSVVPNTAEARHLFGQTSVRPAADRNDIFSQKGQDGWQTYNFEVAETHTYIAGGVRVHNQSGEFTLINGKYYFDSYSTPYHDMVDIEAFNKMFENGNNNPDGTVKVPTGGGFEYKYRPGHQFEGRDYQPGGDMDGDNELTQQDRVMHDIDLHERHAEIARVNGDERKAEQHERAADDLRDNGNDNEGDDNGKPVILDLDGDGVEINVNGNVSFDMDRDGFKEQTAWAAADDGFLVIDLNENGSRGAGDGKIDQTKELILSEWAPNARATDLEALATFDQWERRGGNNDGVLSAKDSVWNELKVWQDLNQDGVTDDGELKTLSQLGITQINLTYDDETHYQDTDNDVTIFGNTLLGSASYTRDGKVVKGGVGDVSLRYNAEGWRKVETSDGYYIEFEGGETLRYGVMDGTGVANWDVNARNFDVVVGDARGNELIATGQTRGVSISGGSGNDIVRGGHGDDMLSGGAGWDRISGGDGNDTIFFDATDGNFIYGGSGYDLAYAVGEAGVTLSLSDRAFEAATGSDGNDTLDASGLTSSTTLHGRGGADTLTGGSSDDLLSGDDGRDVLVGGAAGDMLIGGFGADKLSGGDGDDTLFGGEDADMLYGQGGDDTLFGGAGVDILEGGARDDYLDGGAQNDKLYGGEGDDTLFGGHGNDFLSGANGDDFLSGGAGNDVIHAGNGDEVVEGGQGDDTIRMFGWGDNTIDGGAGNDRIHAHHSHNAHEISAGAGHDTLYLTKKRSEYDIVELQGARVSGEKYLYGYRVTYLNANGWVEQEIIVKDVEQIIFGDGKKRNLSNDVTPGAVQNEDWVWYTQGFKTDNTKRYNNSDDTNAWGGAGDDKIWSDSNNGSGADHVRMGAGNDTLHLLGGSDIGEGSSGNDALYGGRGKDTLSGNGGADRLDGGDNADTVDGSTGADLIQGGNGNDKLTGGAGADVIYGGEGNDGIWAGSGADIVEAGGGADAVYGGTGRDSLGGGSGNDTIYGGDGADRLDGDGNDDKLYGENGDDTLDGGDGNDILEGGADDDRLDGGKGVDTLRGGDGFDVLNGGDWNDSLFGGALDDSLFGDSGNDYLDGGSGNDYLEGGWGADTIKGQDGVRDVVGYAQSGYAVGINLGAGTAWGGHAQGDKISGVEGVVGSNFSDTLVGNGLDNQLYGGKGNDVVRGWSGRDELYGDEGNDSLRGDNQDDTLFGGAGNDCLWGNSDDDVLSGGAGNDYIHGGGHTDRLLGGDGHDTLVGGHGQDELTGGDGWDKFVFTDALQANQVDTITDFNPKYDEFHLKNNIFANFDLGEIKHTQFKVGPEATEAAHRIIYKKGTGEIFYDRDGNGAAQAKLFAKVEEGTNLTHWDFEVI